MSKPLRWGIISTGGIATNFSKDLLCDPKNRDASDVQHVITAIGSRSVPSAEKFLDKLQKADAPADWGGKNGKLEGCKAYGSYEEVYADPNVDVVYIGTPHTMHHRNTKDALLAGKNVLCEKPFTLSMEELDELIALAKEKKLFLMEAVWTRFHPIMYAIQDVLFSGKLGKVKRFQADFSMFFDIDNRPDDHRMVDPALGGGSLLDMGPYPSVWAMMTLFHHPDNKQTPPEIVFTHQTVYERSNVDLNSRWLLQFPGLGGVQALLTTDMDTNGCGEMTALISCEKADMAIAWGPMKPEKYWIIPHARKQPGSIQEKSEHHHPVVGNSGMAYEADEVYRCLQKGVLESDRMTWEDSKMVQGWFDRVRNEGNTALKGLKGTAGQ